MNRSTWHARTSAVVLTWLAAAAVVALAHRQVPASTWLMVHLMMLGAVTNALVIWSWHFTVAVLRAPPARSRREDRPARSATRSRSEHPDPQRQARRSQQRGEQNP